MSDLSKLEYGRVMYSLKETAVYGITTPPNKLSTDPVVKMKLMFGEGKEDVEVSLAQVFMDYDFIDNASNKITDPHVYASVCGVVMQINNFIASLKQQSVRSNIQNP